MSQSVLLSSLPSFLFKMTLTGSSTSCHRNQKPLLCYSLHQSMAGKWRIGLRPAKAKPWLLLSWRLLRGACVVATCTLHGRRLMVNMEAIHQHFCSVSITGGSSSHPLMLNRLSGSIWKVEVDLSSDNHWVFVKTRWWMHPITVIAVLMELELTVIKCRLTPQATVSWQETGPAKQMTTRSSLWQALRLGGSSIDTAH